MRFFLVCVLAALLWPAMAWVRVERDGVLTLADYGYRDWDPELLHFTVAKGFKPGRVVVTDAAGQPVPCQLDGDTLCFVAGLGKGKTARYTVTAGTPAASPLRTTKANGLLEIGNGRYTLRVPAPGVTKFAQPAPAATVPGPLQGWQPAGGPWMGRSRFVTERGVTRVTARLLADGPACVRYEARYTFASAGEYVFTAQVCAGLDRADITEEFDFGAVTPGHDFLLFEPCAGARTIGLVKPGGEAQLANLDRQPLDAYLAPKLKAGDNPPAPVGGAGATPMPPVPAPGLTLLEKIAAGGKWGGLIGGLLLEDAAGARAAVVPMHVGNWRRAMALTVWHQPGAGVTVALPISVRPITWYAETADDISPFSTHEHDAGLRAGYGRREWALTGAAAPQALQARAGYIGLDAYKEWLLDWPERAIPALYPRAWFTRDDVARLRKTLETHPDRAALEKFFVFSGKPEDAKRHAEQAIAGILGQMGYLGNWYVPGLSHYRQAQFFAQFGPLADDALACPALPPALRTELRRTLAFAAYLLADPDLNPRGAGVHLGNNNMSINRTCALAACAGLLPDHPRYAYWMTQAAEFTRYKLATHVALDGTNLECPTYQLYGPMRFLDDSVTILRNAGGPDFAPYIAANMQYLANLTVPDARFDGRRIIPGMGNSSNQLESIFGISLATVERANPALAAQLRAVHLQSWPTEPVAGLPCNHIGNAFRCLPDITPSPAPLATTFIPTYGVVFRNHYGTPRETALLFRAGTNWGHWDTDALNVILYGPNGAPLSPGTGYQYYYGAGSQDNIIYHNRVKVGGYTQAEIFGRVDGAVSDYGFGPSADYAVASRYYPPEAFSDKGGAMRWNRHVLFLKGAATDYFVMRDTFPGGEGRPTWWTWMNLGGPEAVRVDGKAFDPAAVPVNKLVAEAAMPAADGRTLALDTPYGAGTTITFADPQRLRARMTWDYPQGGRLGMKAEWFPKLAAKETKTTIEAVGKPGADYLYAVYPRTDGEAAVTKLADGALRVTTPESTDYVFLGDAPFAYDAGDVSFSGTAGAVRVYRDRVTLCLNAGSGRVGYKGCIIEGAGPAERTVPLAALQPGVTAVGGTVHGMQTKLLDGITVRGEGPFDAVLDGHTLRITTYGRARVLYVTRPPWIERPSYTVDGREWMACWTDYPASGWGTYANTHLVALAVPDGKHVLTLTNGLFPPVWERKFTPTIAGAVVAE